jgi:hypothetical protein
MKRAVASREILFTTTCPFGCWMLQCSFFQIREAVGVVVPGVVVLLLAVDASPGTLQAASEPAATGAIEEAKRDQNRWDEINRKETAVKVLVHP